MSEYLDHDGLEYYTSKILSKLGNASSTSSGIPAGSVMFFAAENAPEGWLFCNGASVSVVDYPELYSVIGTKFGGGGAEL